MCQMLPRTETETPQEQAPKEPLSRLAPDAEEAGVSPGRLREPSSPSLHRQVREPGPAAKPIREQPPQSPSPAPLPARHSQGTAASPGKKSHRSQAGTRPFPTDPHPDQPRLQGHAAPSHPGTDHPSCSSEGLLRGGSRLVPGLKAGARLQLGLAFGSWKFSVCLSHTPTRAHLGREGTETLGKAALVARGAGRWHTGTARLCQPRDPALGIP